MQLILNEAASKNSKFLIGPTEGKAKTSVSIQLSSDTMLKLLKRALSSQQAFMKGLVKISGKMTDAMKLDSVIAALDD